MKYISLCLSCFLMCLCVSCLEKIDIATSGSGDMFVIDALVTDFDSVQHVYIRRELEPCLSPMVPYEYPIIEDVTVHIEDDNGWSADFVNHWEGREFDL